jgi:hypothetical protein
MATNNSWCKERVGTAAMAFNSAAQMASGYRWGMIPGSRPGHAFSDHALLRGFARVYLGAFLGRSPLSA